MCNYKKEKEVQIVPCGISSRRCIIRIFRNNNFPACGCGQLLEPTLVTSLICYFSPLLRLSMDRYPFRARERCVCVCMRDREREGGKCIPLKGVHLQYFCKICVMENCPQKLKLMLPQQSQTKEQFTEQCKNLEL